MPSQADDSFLPVKMIDHFEDASVVSMPSQADDSFLQSQKTEETDMITTCQRPLRLMTHFYRRAASLG